jgi:hypothetical protein
MAKKKEEPKKVATWGKMLTREELLALLARLEAKKIARKEMAEEAKKSKNPFIAAAQKVAANPKVPGAKTAQVQQVKKPQVQVKKPATRSAGRGR